MMTFNEFIQLVQGKREGVISHEQITELLTDSRKAVAKRGAIFFCIAGEHHDGHDYISTIYDLGIRLFVTEKFIHTEKYPEASFLLVPSSIHALQALVANHREQFSIPVIGITGSNGKTIIKEWLSQLLAKEYNIVKSPASYNSQLGVPLSVWQIQKHHQLGIFEAGISKPGEMERIEKVLKPTIGIFTNIGSAHDENFKSQDQKIQEKLFLFKRTGTLIYCRDHERIHYWLSQSNMPTFSWGFNPDSDVRVQRDGSNYRIESDGKEFQLTFPFADKASVENTLHCVALLLYFKYNPQIITERIHQLKAVNMRLELKEGINHSLIIDDTYNNDLGGLKIGLDFLGNQVQRSKRTLILSDILQSGLSDHEISQRIADVINSHGLHYFVGIGPALVKNQELFKLNAAFYETTNEFLKKHDMNAFADQVVLVKGARSFQFERIVSSLQRKVHGTVMEVDLGALVHNLNYFRSRLSPTTKLMVMVKAFAYGSGNVEVANVLQYHKVDYLGVAYADEGVELRKNNIHLPIMVMNPSEDGFQVMMDYNLEPEIYSFKILNEFIHFLEGRSAKVHLKIDTGMHRLGFTGQDVDTLISVLKENSNLNVQSIFTHLAGSDEKIHDMYSIQQANEFQQCAERLIGAIGYRPMLHVLNTPGILRFPQYQMDMVRLGIGLYGVDPTQEGSPLKQVATLKTVVSQIREIEKDQTVGYGRNGVANRTTRVATIAIGYADGFSRAFSRGKGIVMINGKRAPILGNVCMDMSMVDVTDIQAKEGDEVIIFGKELPLSEVAEKIGTIPYEILTNTSDRVKRVFVAESI